MARKKTPTKSVVNSPEQTREAKSDLPPRTQATLAFFAANPNLLQLFKQRFSNLQNFHDSQVITEGLAKLLGDAA